MKVLLTVCFLLFLNCIPRYVCGGAVSLNGTPMVQGTIYYDSYDCLVEQERHDAQMQKRDPRTIPEYHVVGFTASQTGVNPRFSIIVEKDGEVVARGASRDLASGYSSYRGFYASVTALVSAEYDPPFDVRVINTANNLKIDFTVEPLNR